MPPVLRLGGQQLGRLTVLKRVKNGRRDRAQWKCRCSCGREVTVLSDSLRTGRTRSCGCLRIDLTKLRETKHGQSGTGRKQPTRTYNSWRAMVQRCTDPKFARFPKYGALGVKVCVRWLGKDGFNNFQSDLGKRPEGTTLGRFGDVGNYEPGNVKWMSSTEQRQNWRPDRNLGGARKAA
jgi:hypothetical protein